MFLCIPVIFGCHTSLKPDGVQQSPRICPRCHNASVIAAKSTNWFELFWVPLVPYSKKHIWLCHICQWQAPVMQGQEPPSVGQFQYQQPIQDFNRHLQAGYAPAYIPQTPQK